MADSDQKLTLYTPANYRIKVQGQLDETWSSHLGEIEIKTKNTSKRGLVTTLEGMLLDQAALAGVLDMLYTLGLPLISVEQTPVGQVENQT